MVFLSDYFLELAAKMGIKFPRKIFSLIKGYGTKI